MEFRCEDLPQHGVVLVPPTSREYDTLLAEIRRRLENPVAGSPPPLPLTGPRFPEDERFRSAILVNRGPTGIAAVQQVWTFQEAGGRSYTSSFGGVTGSSVLLPFGLPERLRKLYGYWHVILPGSKRYLDSRGDILGDNSDVRPPDPDEAWQGGIVRGRGGGGRLPGLLERVTLTLDGVFFTDGGFAGPNRRGLWDQVVGSAEAHLEAAEIARRGRRQDLTPERIFAEIERALGPAGDRPPRLRRRQGRHPTPIAGSSANG